MTDDGKADKKRAAADGKKKRSVMEDPQTHTDFSFNLDSCVVQGSRDDVDATPTDQGVVERVWIMSRPPGLVRGVQPTVTARRAYVMLKHVQGETMETCDLVCKKACTTYAGTRGEDADNQQAAACSARGGNSACD